MPCLLGAFEADGFLGKAAVSECAIEQFGESLFLVFDHFLYLY